MSYGIIVQVPTDVIEAINDAAQQSPKLMQTTYKRATSRLKSRWIRALRVEPPSASHAYPLPWTSEKQRRAFFASKGFGRGIPTVRTHALRDAWDVQIDTSEAGGAVTVTNDAPEARYVIGDDRQVMFEVIGWADPIDINTEFLDEAEEVLIQTYFLIADPFAGVNG